MQNNPRSQWRQVSYGEMHTLCIELGVFYTNLQHFISSNKPGRTQLLQFREGSNNFEGTLQNVSLSPKEYEDLYGSAIFLKFAIHFLWYAISNVFVVKRRKLLSYSIAHLLENSAPITSQTPRDPVNKRFGTSVPNRSSSHTQTLRDRK
jgi:hypothetical protein